MANKNGIGYSPLTEKVYMGLQNPEKKMWVGEKKDITNQFVAVSFEFFEEDKVRTITHDKTKHLFIHITQTEKSLKKAINHLQKLLLKQK